MDDFQQQHGLVQVSEHAAKASEPHEERQDVPVVTTRRLRDRELLKRKKEEAQQKNTFQWVFGEQAKSKRQRKAKATGRGRKKNEVKEAEPEPAFEPESVHEPEPAHEPQSIHDPEPTHEPDHVFESERSHIPEPSHDSAHEPEPEPETKVSMEQTKETQEYLEHHEDPETEHVTSLIHEEVNGHVLQGSISLLTEKEDDAQAGPALAAEVPEVLSFSMDAEQEEPQYYTPLL